MALLCATHSLAARHGLRLEICTVDHGLRPEATAEVERVRVQATRLGLPFHVRRLQVGHQAGLEARARLQREAALEEVRQERGLDWIATAHTANDQAETLLMRLGRGAGLRGAASILERKGVLIRPLLEVTRAQVEDYLREQGVAFATDPMNSDPTYLRVRVRRQVLPALSEAMGEEAVLHLARFARLAGSDEETLSAQAEDARSRLTLPGGAVDAVGVRALAPALRSRLLRGLLEREGFPVSTQRLEALEQALIAGSHLALDRLTSVRTEGGLLRFAREGAAPPEGAYVLEAGRTVVDHASGLTLCWETTCPPGRWALAIPERALPVLVRRRQPGDRVGLPNGQQAKLQDLLVNAKVPAERRGRLPVIVSSSGDILGVAGVWPTHPPQGLGGWHLVAY